jgi:small subunit ribosomal protein S16
LSVSRALAALSADRFRANFQSEKNMVKIRLSRAGAKGRPFYHVVVTDQRSARDGRNIARLGYYNPGASGPDKRLELDVAKIQEWVGKGAQCSDKVQLLVRTYSQPAK